MAAADDERRKSEFARSELVFGLVAPAGTNLKQITGWLDDYLQGFDYKLEKIQVSDFLKELVPGESYLDHPEHARIASIPQRGRSPPPT